MKLKTILFLIVLTIGLHACEKDDICIAGDTPQMRIAFFNADSTELSKIPSNLLIVGKNLTTALPLVSPSDANGYELLLPLNPSDSSTEFYFVKDASVDSQGTVSGTIELIQFDYQVNPIYISKACGFIPNYVHLQARIENNNTHWIKSLQITKDSITQSKDLHVKIYH